MMEIMVKTYDEFAAYLLKLRSDRRMSGNDLGAAVGKSPEYIGGWERENRRINKAVLHAVCNILKLTEPERRKLFDLADARNLPKDARRPSSPAEQIQLNLAQALSEIEHTELPQDISNDILEFHDAAGWLLSWYAAIGVEGCDFTALDWPEYVRLHKIIIPHAPPKIPVDEFLPADLANLDQLGELNETTAHQLGERLATAYYRWLLSDLERCRTAAQGLKRWSLSDEPGYGLVASFRFADSDANDIFGIDLVTCGAIRTVAKRELAASMWEWSNFRPKDDPFKYYPHVTDADVDTATLPYLTFARAAVTMQRPLTKRMLQGARDARYVIQTPAWESPPIDVEMYTLYAIAVEQIPIQEVDALSEADLAGKIEAAKRRMLSDLRRALELSEAADTAAPEPAASPTKAPAIPKPRKPSKPKRKASNKKKGKRSK